MQEKKNYMRKSLIKISLICLLVAGFYSKYAIPKTYAWVPEGRGRVVTAVTMAPVVGVWVRWMDGLGNYRYAQTDIDGRYYFESWFTFWEYKTEKDRRDELKVEIDTDLDGKKDSPWLAPLDPYEGSWPAFSDGSNNHTFSVAKPISANGNFSVVNVAFIAGINTDSDIEDIIFTPSAPTTYTVGGNVFIDSNGNGNKDNGEQNYSGIPAVTASRGTVTTSPGGLYTITNLTAGSLTVTAGIPTGYSITVPKNGPPPSFQIIVGPTCSVGGSSDASCMP